MFANAERVNITWFQGFGEQNKRNKMLVPKSRCDFFRFVAQSQVRRLIYIKICSIKGMRSQQHNNKGGYGKPVSPNESEIYVLFFYVLLGKKKSPDHI